MTSAIANEQSRLIRVVESQVSCDPVWEDAYRRFETPQQEIEKFLTRLRWFGADKWPREARIAELFCGRGNGLIALEQLGFTDIQGVDLSDTLLEQYSGNATCYVADCRELPFDDNSKDVLIVQGGVHHLPSLPDDLHSVMSEASRVLATDGRLVLVEPWLTPFLRLVHFVMNQPLARRAWQRLDALATMTERELETYEQWLGMPEQILAVLTNYFTPVRCSQRWGKLYFEGRVSG